MDSESVLDIPVTPAKKQLSEVQRLLLAKRLRSDTLPRKEDAVTPRPRGSQVPVSAEQRRVWLHASHQPALALYNEPITLYRYGSFHLGTFEASFNEFLLRHEAWRTHFTPSGESVIAEGLKVHIPFHDLSHLEPQRREEEALRLATEDAAKPLRLDVSPLLRACAVKITSDEHRIYLTLHHIIFDGVSLARVLLPELSTIYEAFERGEVPLLPPPTLQYGDYAIWRERQLTTPEIKDHLAYWVKQLSGELPVLRLPADHPRPVVPTHRGAMKRFDIPHDLKQRLKDLSRSQNVTLYTTLFTAFEVLLFRYSGQQDLIVGSATDARRRSELEHVVGYFLDTLAIRTRPSANLTFSSYLAQTQDTILEAFAAAAVPFDRIVHEVNPRRDSSHHPIFQAFFSMRPVLPNAPRGWKLAHLDVAVNVSKFELYLELGELADHIEGRFLYSTDLFEEATIERIQGHLFALLEAICEAPETTLGSLPILTASETSLLLGTKDWNNTAEEIPQFPVHTLVEQQAQRKPDRAAILCEGRVFTYRELIHRTNSIATALQEIGVQPGSIVAVALDRSLDLLAGLLAILKLGAAYLPLDTLMPTARIATCLEDAVPAAVLTQRSLLEKVAPEPYATLLMEDVPDLPFDDPPSTPKIDAPQGSKALDATAYVIYTSGSTGVPKAVEISHRGLINLLASMQRAPGFQEHDVLLALTSISFDIAALEIFLPLITGGTVVMASREEVQDPYLLAHAIKQSGCTVIQATPATWRTLLRSGWKDGQSGSQPGEQRPLRVLCGGEALTADLAQDLLNTGAELWNMYGPTETTIWSTLHRVWPTDIRAATSLPVGSPIANTQAYILDAQLNLLPVGIRGELFLGGSGLAIGYRGRSQQTADRFLHVEAVGGARLYRTGDLAVRRPDGNLEVVGRSDNQVKIRGYRVELEAVEAFVLQHPDVTAAAARAWPEPGGEMRLSIYVVGTAGQTPGLPEIRSFLSTRLPDYMIPTYVIGLQEMPLTVNGKIDRQRLVAPDSKVASTLKLSGVSPHEAELAAIWGDLLEVTDVGLDEDFFVLGGHSILVAALQQRIASVFGLQLPMASLFHQPTVRLQAELIERSLANAVTLPEGVCALQRRGSGNPLFWLHFANEGLARAVGTDQPFYSVVLTVEDMAVLGNHPTLAAVASFHMQKILATKVEGPYKLGGFCVGGVVAYEVARLLRKAGHEVSAVVLVDSPNPNPDPLKTLFRYVHWVRGKGGLQALFSSFNKRLGDYKSLLANKKLPHTEMRTAQQMIEAAATTYKPRRYDGDVILIQASERLHMDLLPPWQHVVQGNLRNVYVDGHHDDLMKVDNVQHVGKLIRAHLHPEPLASETIPGKLTP